MKPSDYLTTTQAAELAGLERNSIDRAIARGRLNAVKIGRDWLTTEADLLEYLNSRYLFGKHARREEDEA